MRIEYDPEVDILTFWLADGAWEYAIEAAPGVILDLGLEDTPVALEVHQARQRYGEDFVKKHDIYAYRPLPEVAARYGLSPIYLRNLAQKGKLKAKKADGRWLTTPASVEDCVDQLTPSS